MTILQKFFRITLLATFLYMWQNIYVDAVFAQHYELLFTPQSSATGSPLEMGAFAVDEIYNAGDGGAVTLGYLRTTLPGPPIRPNPYIVSFDRFGAVLFAQRYSDAANLHPNQGSGGIIEANDGSFDIIWRSSPPREIPGFSQSLSDVYVCRLNSGGTFLWGRQIGSHFRINEAFELTMTRTGNIAVVGTATDTGATSSKSLYVALLDGTGAVLFQQEYVDSDPSSVYTPGAIRESDGGDLIIAGTLEQASEPADMFLLSINTLGAVNWGRRYGGVGAQRAFDLIMDSNAPGGEHMALVGFSLVSPAPTEIYIVRVNSAGVPTATGTYRNNMTDQIHHIAFSGVMNLADTGYVVTGTTEIDAFALEVDRNLNVVNQALYGQAGVSWGWDIAQSTLGVQPPDVDGYYMSGWYDSGGDSSNAHSYFLRIDAALRSGCERAANFERDIRNFDDTLIVSHIPTSYTQNVEFMYESVIELDTLCVRSMIKSAPGNSPEQRIQPERIANDGFAFPNPVTLGATLSIPLDDSTLHGINVVVMDAVGRVVNENSPYIYHGKNVIRIDTSDLTPGMYIVRIEQNDHTRAYSVLLID